MNSTQVVGKSLIYSVIIRVDCTDSDTIRFSLDVDAGESLIPKYLSLHFFILVAEQKDLSGPRIM
jgi:hypothetical protein